jgi:hypothetical protein
VARIIIPVDFLSATDLDFRTPDLSFRTSSLEIVLINSSSGIKKFGDAPLETPPRKRVSKVCPEHRPNPLENQVGYN